MFIHIFYEFMCLLLFLQLLLFIAAFRILFLFTHFFIFVFAFILFNFTQHHHYYWSCHFPATDAADIAASLAFCWLMCQSFFLSSVSYSFCFSSFLLLHVSLTHFFCLLCFCSVLCWCLLLAVFHPVLALSIATALCS